MLESQMRRAQNPFSAMTPPYPHFLSRRRFLARNAMGVGSVALAWLLREEKLLATPPNIPRGPQSFDLKPKAPQFPPRARAESDR